MPYVREIGSTRRAGGDRRGNCYARRARKLKLLATFGNGESCPCAHCGTALTYATVEADRIMPDGPYRWENVIPSCRRCNASRGDRASWTPMNLTAMRH